MGPVPTLCIVNIKILGQEEIITDHLWVTIGKQLEELNLRENDIISFDARVDSYIKGYQGWRDDVVRSRTLDYKLSKPTKIKLENREVEKIKDIKSQKVTLESIITFGKHKGKKLKEIVKKDINYLIWLKENYTKEDYLFKWLNGKVFHKLSNQLSNSSKE